MLKYIALGVVNSLFLGLVGVAFIMFGSYLGGLTGSNTVGFLLTIPGYLYFSVGYPFIFLIDYLPLYLLFPKGGASGIFGSVILFSMVIWSFVLSILAAKGWWPFTPKYFNKLRSLFPFLKV